MSNEDRAKKLKAEADQLQKQIVQIDKARGQMVQSLIKIAGKLELLEEMESEVKPKADTRK